MAIIVKHSFVSSQLDGADPTIVRPSNWNDEHELTGDGWLLAGMVLDWIGHTLPTYLLECFGQSLTAATYPALFAALVKQATVTLTLGTPGVVNWTSHGLVSGSKFRLRTTGALPTGLVANTDYYVLSAGFTASAFRVAATVGGTAIDFSGSQSGVHTGINAQYGVSNDLVTFTAPDLRGRVTAGLDTMGGTAAGRLTGLAGGVAGGVMGAVGGVETHTLAITEVAAHVHNNVPPDPVVSLVGINITVNSGGAHTHTVTGTVDSGGAHTHTVTGTISAEASHTHAVDPPSTSTGIESINHTHNTAIGKSVAETSFDVSTEVLIPVGGTLVAFASGGVSDNHTHAVNIASFSSGAGSSHTHTFSAGAAASGGAHTHTFSAGSAVSGGAHTHTASASGTATSTQAAYNSASAGGGGAHNNVQPTFIVRKVLYVG